MTQTRTPDQQIASLRMKIARLQWLKNEQRRKREMRAKFVLGGLVLSDPETVKTLLPEVAPRDQEFITKWYAEFCASNKRPSSSSKPEIPPLLPPPATDQSALHAEPVDTASRKKQSRRTKRVVQKPNKAAGAATSAV